MCLPKDYREGFFTFYHNQHTSPGLRNTTRLTDKIFRKNAKIIYLGDLQRRHNNISTPPPSSLTQPSSAYLRATLNSFNVLSPARIITAHRYFFRARFDLLHLLLAARPLLRAIIVFSGAMRLCVSCLRRRKSARHFCVYLHALQNCNRFINLLVLGYSQHTENGSVIYMWI